MDTEEFYNIRDNIIPLGKIENLEKYLENDIFLDNKQIVDIIETFYGTAISINNIQMISLLNLFVREHNIKINKLNVIKEIYYADCRHKHAKQYTYGCLIEFGPFDGNIQLEYINKYWNIFTK